MYTKETKKFNKEFKSLKIDQIDTMEMTEVKKSSLYIKWLHLSSPGLLVFVFELQTFQLATVVVSSGTTGKHIGSR